MAIIFNCFFLAFRISCRIVGLDNCISVGFENIVPYEECVRSTNSEEVTRLEVITCHPFLYELGGRDERLGRADSELQTEKDAVDGVEQGTSPSGSLIDLSPVLSLVVNILGKSLLLGSHLLLLSMGHYRGSGFSDGQVLSSFAEILLELLTINIVPSFESLDHVGDGPRQTQLRIIFDIVLHVVVDMVCRGNDGRNVGNALVLEVLSALDGRSDDGSKRELEVLEDVVGPALKHNWRLAHLWDTQ
jgi:hypothetical protein